MPYIIRENWVTSVSHKKKIAGPFYFVYGATAQSGTVGELVQTRDITRATRFATLMLANGQVFRYGKGREHGRVEVIEVP